VSSETMRAEGEETGGETKGAVMMTVGKLLLWTSLIPLSWVYSGVKGGSYLWVYWLLTQGTVGFIFLITGWVKRGSLSE
jgi:hypothetical protein